MNKRDLKGHGATLIAAASTACRKASMSFLEAAGGAFRRDPGAVFEVALNIAVVLVLVITVTY